MVVECAVFGEGKLKDLLDKSVVIMLAWVVFNVRLVSAVYLRVTSQVNPRGVERSLRLKLKLKFDGVSKMTNIKFF